MNKIFKNKMFIILIFSALFVLALNCSSFASSSKSFTLKSGEKLTFDNFPDDFIYNDYLILYCSSQDCYFVYNYDSSKVCLGFAENVLSGGNVRYGVYCFWFDGSCAPIDGLYPGSYALFARAHNGKFSDSPSNFGSSGFVDSKNLGDNYFNTSEVYSVFIGDDGNYCLDKSQTVFQGAPQAQVEPLKEITQVGELQPAIAKIVAMVLPACLTIFGVLLVLYLMVSKNLLQL